MGVHDAVIYGILRRNARVRGDEIALISDGKRITYREFLDSSDRVAGGLYRAGVRSGDRVAVLAKNSPEFVYLYAACARIGAIMLPGRI